MTARARPWSAAPQPSRRPSPRRAARPGGRRHRMRGGLEARFGAPVVSERIQEAEIAATAMGPASPGGAPERKRISMRPDRREEVRMKLATFSSGAGQRVGAVIDGGRRIVDLSRAFPDMLALIEAGDAGRATAEEIVADPPPDAVVDLAAVRLGAPLPCPPQIRDFLCFEEHLRNSFAQAERMTGRKFEIPAVWYEQPIYYKANRFSVIGPDEEIRWPGYADVLDYELELACVIGRSGVDISRGDAAAHLFGWTIFNDISARDAQMREMAGQLGPAKGKDFDTGNVLGP